MIKRNDIWLVAIVGLIIYIIYLQSCTGDKMQNTTIVKTEYIFDTVVRELPIVIPQVRYEILPSDTVRIPYTDTNYCKEIAHDYLTKRYYADTTINDSVDIYSYAKVVNNSLDSLKLAYKIKFPVQQNTIIQQNRIKFYIGANVGSDFQNHFYTGIDLMLIDKKEFAYRLGAAFSPTGGLPICQFGFNYKLKFKKK